jgi:hypothetical protein
MSDTDGGTTSAKTGASMRPPPRGTFRSGLGWIRESGERVGLIELLGRPPGPRCRLRARAAEAG